MICGPIKGLNVCLSRLDTAAILARVAHKFRNGDYVPFVILLCLRNYKESVLLRLMWQLRHGALSGLAERLPTTGGN